MELGSHLCLLLQLPVGWVGPSHRDPVPQLNVFLSGQGNWTVADGTSHVFSAGDLYFGEDQLSKTGHFSENIGNVPVMMALMQFGNQKPTVNQPCWLK